MKTARVSKHFVISLNFPCLIACLLSSFTYVVFVLFVLWLGLWVDVAVDRISRISIYPPPPSHLPSLFLFCFCFCFFSSYPQFSLQHKCQLFEISAGLKLALVPFSSLHFIIAWSPCEKFPGEHHVKLWDGTKLLRFAESASSNIVLYSRFIWLNGSITLIRAETERYDIFRFSKATTKSLASRTGS